MKSYPEAIAELAKLKQDTSFRYVCQAAFQLLARLYDVPVDAVYDDVQVIIDADDASRKAARKQQHWEENEARRLANLLLRTSKLIDNA
jgi:hypothetical protein